MKRIALRLGALGMLLVILLTLPGGCTEEPTQAAGALPPEVGIITVQPAELPMTSEFVGQTEASQLVEIRARVGGTLLKRSFEEGSMVSAGELLYTIDDREFQANLAVYKARLANAEAQAARWKREADRITPLLALGSASQKELDDAQSSLDASLADARQQNANIARAELDLSYATIRAPIAGRIGKSSRAEGSLVDAGANSLLTTILRLDPIHVNFAVSERDLLNVRRLQAAGRVAMPEKEQVRVAIVLLDGTLYDGGEGKLNFADFQLDPRTGTANLRAEIPNAKELLFPGQFVKVRIYGARRLSAITVPQRAVLQTPGGAFIYVVASDNKVQARKVQVGAWSGNDWIIDEGLNAGDRVIVDGLQRVQAGMTVRSTPATTIPATQPTGA